METSTTVFCQHKRKQNVMSLH